MTYKRLLVSHKNVLLGGGWEDFVVGTNYAVFHRWAGSSGWHSLGGQAYRGCAGTGCYLNGWRLGTGNDIRMCVQGTDRNLWHRDRVGGGWQSTWYRGC